MYGFSITLNTNFETAVTRATEALKTQGFGVLTEIDVQATLKKKLGEDMRPYRILGACNPTLAHRAITAEPDIGLLLPCNVVVRQEEDGSILVSFVDPVAMLGIVGRDDMAVIAEQVKGLLLKVRDALA